MVKLKKLSLTMTESRIDVWVNVAEVVVVRFLLLVALIEKLSFLGSPALLKKGRPYP